MNPIKRMWKNKKARAGFLTICSVVVLAVLVFGSWMGQNSGDDSGFSFSGGGFNSGWTSTKANSGGGINADGLPEDIRTDAPIIMGAQQTTVGVPPDQQGGGANSDGAAGSNSSAGTQTDPGQSGANNSTTTPSAETGGSLTCTFSIRCDTILNNMDTFNEKKVSILPKDGVILQTTKVSFSEGETVFDVLARLTREKKIHMESSFVPLYNSAYIEGIRNIYEFDCGPLSGWMYKVNDWFPNYGCSSYTLCDGDKVEWVYTCDLGKDVGGTNAVGGK